MTNTLRPSGPAVITTGSAICLMRCLFGAALPFTAHRKATGPSSVRKPRTVAFGFILTMDLPSIDLFVSTGDLIRGSQFSRCQVLFLDSVFQICAKHISYDRFGRVNPSVCGTPTPLINKLKVILHRWRQQMAPSKTSTTVRSPNHRQTRQAPDCARD